MKKSKNIMKRVREINEMSVCETCGSTYVYMTRKEKVCRKCGARKSR